MNYYLSSTTYIEAVYNINTTYIKVIYNLNIE